LAGFPALPQDYDTWMFGGGMAVCRREAAGDLRALLHETTLYDWAARQPGRESFTGRGAAYGVSLGSRRLVVRHARHGGALAPLLRDRYLGPPRFLREIAMSQHLQGCGIATPTVVAGVLYRSGVGHRADIATERVDGRDLAEIFFGAAPPTGELRNEILSATGKAIRRLHDCGLIHPDLQLRNVLIEDPSPSLSAPPSPSAWLLDIDTCRAVRKGDDASLRWNLRRFARSWEKFNRLRGPRLTEGDRAAFAAGYSATS
jgi:hypothetical protein